MTPEEYCRLSDAEREAAADAEVEAHRSGRIPMEPLVRIRMVPLAIGKRRAKRHAMMIEKKARRNLASSLRGKATRRRRAEVRNED